MRAGSVVNEDPVDPQSRTVTEPQREAPPKQASKTPVFWGFFCLGLCAFFKAATGFSTQIPLLRHIQHIWTRSDN